MSSNALQEWKERGSFIQAGPLSLNLFVKQLGDPGADPDKTLLLIHGFPESSFSYHKIVAGMENIFDRIILFDFPGFGRKR